MMGKREEKSKDVKEELKDSVIAAPAILGGGTQPLDVDLRKGRPKEEKWSYLIAFLIPVLIVVIFLVIALIS